MKTIWLCQTRTQNIVYFSCLPFRSTNNSPTIWGNDLGAENINRVCTKAADTNPVEEAAAHFAVRGGNTLQNWSAGAARYQALAGSNKFLIAGEHQGLRAPA
jgi:hypothetical protein